MTRRQIVLMCALAVLPSLACSQASPSEQGEASLPTPALGAIRVPAAEVVEATRLREPVSLAAFTDGTVTFAEYEAATIEFVQCVSESGGALSRPLSAGALQVFSVDFVYRTDASAEVQAAIVRCGAAGWDRISRLWALSHGPSQETLHQARDAMAECLRSLGLTLPESPTARDFRESGDPAKYIQCSQQVSDQFGIPYFGG